MGPITLIALIGFIYFLVFLIRRNLLRPYVKPLFISYVIILLFSFGLYEIVISKQVTVIATKQQEEYGSVINLDEEANKLYAAISEGNSEAVDFTKASAETVDYDARQLTILSEDDAYFGLIILVERKAVNDRTIESSLYQPKHLIGELDVIQEVNPIRLHWENEALRLLKQPELEIELAAFKKEFPITQFTGEGWFDIDGSPLISNYQVLLLRVPKDLKIVNRPNFNLYEMDSKEGQ